MGNVKVEKKIDEEHQDENTGSELAERRDYSPWNWFSDFDDMLRDFRQSFGRWFPVPFRGHEFSPWVEPRLDIKATDTEYIVHADLPGMEKENVTLEVHDDRLIIKAESKEEKEEKGEGYIQRERGYQSYFRTVPLPDDALRQEDVDA